MRYQFQYRTKNDWESKWGPWENLSTPTSPSRIMLHMYEYLKNQHTQKITFTSAEGNKTQYRVKIQDEQ